MKAVDGRVTSNFEDSLVSINKYGQTVGALAESWDHNEDYSVWTFHLRDGLKWSDRNGDVYADITADDFLYSIEYILDPENASPNTEMLFVLEGAKEYYDQKVAGKNPSFSMVGAKALDSQTIQYTMENGGKPYFISTVQYQSYKPTNRQFVESLEDRAGTPGRLTYGSTPDLLLYSGMYIMDEVSKDAEKTYKPNPDYWDKENIPFEKVVIKAIKDNETALEYFERGELNWAPLTSTQFTAQKEYGNNYINQKPLYNSTYVLFLNNQTMYSEDTNKALSNEDFRQSLYHGFDADMFNEVNIPDNVEQVRSKSYSGPNYITSPSGKDYLDMGELGKIEYGYNKEEALEYKEKAIEALKEQGVTFPIVLKHKYKSGNELAAQHATMLKESFESNLGEDYITIELGEYSNSFITEVRDKGDYAFFFSGWSPDYADPVNTLNTMMSTGQMNNYENLKLSYSHFYLPEFDQMVNEANAEVTDLEVRYEKFANAEAYLLNHAYMIPVYVTGGSYYVTSVNPYSKPFTGSDTAYLKGWEVLDHAISTEEMEKLKEEWLAKRKELGFTDKN